jgi:hypothetical protein
VAGVVGYHLLSLRPRWLQEDVTRPVTELAGSDVDALVVQVDGGSGLWYPSKVGHQHMRHAPKRADGKYSLEGEWDDGLGDDIGSIRWRAWQSLAALDQQGVDLLAEMISAAHSQDMELHGG